MRADEVPKVPEYQKPPGFEYRPTPALEATLRRLGLSSRIVDVPRNLELIAAHIEALDERLSALESKARR